MSFLLDIIADLASSALWECAKDPLWGAELRSSEPTDIGAWESTVKQTLETTLGADVARLGGVRSEEIADYLRSTEVRRLVTQIYYARVDDSGIGLASARQAFAAIWAARHGKVDGFDPYGLFDLLVASCEHVLDTAVQKAPAVAAHEAKSASRHHATTQRLRAIEQQLGYILGSSDIKPILLSDVDEAIRAIVAGANKRHGTIFPPSLYGARRVPLDELYVAPHFAIEGSTEAMTYRQLRDGSQRVVVLGSPGAGKTTLLRKMSTHIRDDNPRGMTWPAVIVIGLREYAQELQRAPTSIRNFLSSVAASQYQLEIEPAVLEYALVSGMLCVAFDGLDELQVISQRRDIIGNIEAFADKYPQAPLIVTSRVVGYEHAALDPDLFACARLMDFTREQATEYATKWFALDDRSDLPDAAQRTAAFVEESESVPDLRANPLLLGLMCNLYTGRGFIPRNRPEVYEKCATMLFETWDAQRNIGALKPFEDLLRPTIRHLAFWIYGDPQLSVGVTEKAATLETQRFLAKWRFGGDMARAEQPARSFIEFCRGRAWVFSDLGADSADSAVFQFTHQTFLEFFAAEQLVQEHESTDSLVGAIRPRIERDEWEVVTQLAVQMQQRRHLGAADAMLRTLVDAGQELGSCVGFTARALHNVVPTPATVSTVSAATLALMRADLEGIRSFDSTLARRLASDARTRLVELMSCDAENRETVVEIMRDVTKRWIEKPSSRSWGLELAMLGHLALPGYGKKDPVEWESWWLQKFQTIRLGVRGALVDAAREGDQEATYYCCRNGWVSWVDAVETHGLDFLTYAPRPRAFLRLLPSLSVMAAFYPKHRRVAQKLLAHLLAKPAPWFTLDAITELDVVTSGRLQELGSSTFGALLVAALVEPAADYSRRRPPESSAQAYLLLERAAEKYEDEYAEAPLAVRLLLGRGDVHGADELVSELRETSEDEALVRTWNAWLRREIEFTEK